MNASVQSLNQHRTDLELVKRLAERNPEAWAEFIERYQRSIQKRIEATAHECRFVLDRVDIEDVAAEVFRILVANEMSCLKSFRGISSLEGWLMVIVRRTCLQYLSRRPRDRGRGAGVDDSTTYQFDFAGEDGDAALGMIRQEEKMELLSRLKGLREADRLVLRLHFIEELSYQEIGTRMGLSTNAVGPKLHRAQQRLKKLIGDNRHEP